MAGTRGRLSSTKASASSAVASQGLPDIMRIPSSTKVNPSPMTTPSSAGRGTQAAARRAIPVAVSTIQSNPVVSAAPTTVPAPSPAARADWLTAATPI